ncbi:hypothetical protein A5717_29530 [Mycolicibacterium porcinum]|uniref:hypothetical protein n=1 Tax=Mycolicibacterium porcinum TaxID=39693 RepID=UPI00080BD9E0|nr:hypothetical protein [Mycolicibacterium porcinum]OCB08168.1 hypothetical protein A5717_29530 [Mycolicibacterium porcinum]
MPAIGPHAAAEALTRLVIGAASKSDIPGGVLAGLTGEFARIYGLSRDTLLLIRPDGYIGHIAIHNIVELPDQQ